MDGKVGTAMGRWLSVAIVAAALVQISCTSADVEEGKQGVLVVVALPDDLKVTVTATPHRRSPIKKIAAAVEGGWEIAFTGFRADDQVAFTAEATDEDGKVLYETNGPQTITIRAKANQNDDDPVLLLVLHEVVPDGPGFENNAPVIGAVLGAQRISPGFTIDFQVLANDLPAEGQEADTLENGGLKVEWQAQGGTFSPDNLPDAVYTAPTQSQTDVITVSVTDSLGAAVQLSFEVRVGDLISDVTIVIPTVNINHAPDFEVHGITTSGITPDLNESITLTVNATDEDGDELSYVWTNVSERLVPGNGDTPRVCHGTFANGAQPNEHEFTVLRPERVAQDLTSPVSDSDGNKSLLPAELLKQSGTLGLAVGGPCILRVEVTDARGAKNSGIIVVQPGASSNGFFPVVSDFERDHHSNASGAGGMLPNQVAHDAQGAECRNTGSTNATLSHLVEVDENSGNTTSFLGFSYSIAENAGAECGEFALVGFPLVAEVTQDLSGMSSLVFRLKSLSGSDQEVRLTLRETGPRDCDGDMLTPRAATSGTYIATSSWQDFEVPMEHFVGLNECDYDFARTGTIGFEIAFDAAALSSGPVAGDLGLDDIALVR